MSPALAVRGTGKFGWGSLLASGDLQFITSASGSAASSISINGCFSAAYDHYLVMRNLLGSAGGVSLDVRLRVSSTDASGANYRTQGLSASDATIGGARYTGDTSFRNVLGYTEATSIGFSRLWISNPFAAVRTTAWSDHSVSVTGSLSLQSFVYEHDLATSYDGLSIIPASGTVTGSLYVYGLAV